MNRERPETGQKMVRGAPSFYEATHEEGGKNDEHALSYSLQGEKMQQVGQCMLVILFCLPHLLPRKNLECQEATKTQRFFGASIVIERGSQSKMLSIPHFPSLPRHSESDQPTAEMGSEDRRKEGSLDGRTTGGETHASTSV